MYRFDQYINSICLSISHGTRYAQPLDTILYKLLKDKFGGILGASQAGDDNVGLTGLGSDPNKEQTIIKAFEQTGISLLHQDHKFKI